MTSEEFAIAMREIYPEDGDYDTETAHGDADALMEDVLIDLGYREGIEIFQDADKFYM